MKLFGPFQSDFEYMNCALFSMVMIAHLHDGTVDASINFLNLFSVFMYILEYLLGVYRIV